MAQLLPNSISSAQDLELLIIEIREYANWFKHNAIKERVHAKHTTPPPTLTPGALELVRSVGSKKLVTSNDIDALVTKLESTKKLAPSVTLTLAAPATGSIKQSLVASCREHINENALVTFKFNSSLLGGMVVAYGSHVFDWSFRRQILENKAAFPEVLSRV